jgi:hypothetical protein
MRVLKIQTEDYFFNVHSVLSKNFCHFLRHIELYVELLPSNPHLSFLVAMLHIFKDQAI